MEASEDMFAYRKCHPLFLDVFSCLLEQLHGLHVVLLDGFCLCTPAEEEGEGGQQMEIRVREREREDSFLLRKDHWQVDLPLVTKSEPMTHTGHM